MPTRNINLTPQLDQFVAQQIADGQFRNVSEVLRAGLRLLEQQMREDREKLALLRRLTQDGLSQLDEGEGIPIESKRQLAEVISKIGRSAARKSKPHAGSR